MGFKLLDSKKSHGFTLIEMAIVLVIVMSILTLGLGALSSVMTSSAISETKARQTYIKDALIAYFGANKRLPCPDIPNNTNGTAGSYGVTGNEDRAAGACAGQFGVVPFATLGLSRDVAEDGGGGFISYQPFYASPAPNCTGIPRTGIDWTNSECFGAGKAGGITIADGSVSSPNDIATQVVAVIVSHGQNGLGAWLRQGTRNANPVTCEEAHNALTVMAGCTLTGNRFFQGARSGNDDVVAYLTADDIIQALAKQGAIKSASAKMQNDFDRLGAEVISLKIAGYTPATAGPPPVSATCTTGITPFTPSDRSDPLDNLNPWGIPYLVIENAAGKHFPICVCSTGGIAAQRIGSTLVKSSDISIVVANAGTTADTTTCHIPRPTTDNIPNPTVCREITNADFNGYISNAGKNPC